MKLEQLEFSCDYFDLDEKFYQKLQATPLKDTYLISYNKSAADLINLDYEECEKDEFIEFVNGQKVLNGSTPYSMVYAGHQFGYFVPQLGDGRAINLGSVNNYHLQTKGSGITRYSRRGDGRAVLRSSIREYIMSEAMHSLGIPTTRALALIGSEHMVQRDWDMEKGAIVMRVSPSWVRIGTFEFFAKSEDSKTHLRKLADYVINQSYPHLKNEEHKYEKMFYELVDNTASLMAKWQAYGFMHGVMNTDNMSIAGLTIDYGPFAFMDYFQKHCICNHTDSEGRYSYNNQPYIAKWNLSVLATSLRQIADFKSLVQYLDTFFHQHEKEYLELMNKRLGLDITKSGDRNVELVIELQKAMEEAKIDYNVFFYRLTKLSSFEDLSSILDICINKEPIRVWFEKYKEVVETEDSSFEKRKEIMKKVNPKYIIKNYMLQEAIAYAEDGEFELVNDLLNIAQNPFDEHTKYERFAQPTPMEHANLRLSCSS